MWMFNLADGFSHVHLCLVVILDCIHKIQSYVLLIKSTLVIIKKNYTWQLFIDALYFKSLKTDSCDMSKPCLTPALMQDSTCYWNPLGSRKIYVDVQKSSTYLNALENKIFGVQMTRPGCLSACKLRPDPHPFAYTFLWIRSQQYGL